MKNESFVCYLFVFFSCIEWPMVTFIAFNQPIFSLCIFFCRYTLRSNPNVCMQTLCKDCNHATKRVDQRVFTHSHTPDGTPQHTIKMHKCQFAHLLLINEARFSVVAVHNHSSLCVCMRWNMMSHHHNYWCSPNDNVCEHIERVVCGSGWKLIYTRAINWKMHTMYRNFVWSIK